LLKLIPGDLPEILFPIRYIQYEYNTISLFVILYLYNVYFAENGIKERLENASKIMPKGQISSVRLNA
jgi:hypothetical protein